MEIIDLLSSERISASDNVTSKKRALEIMSTLLVEEGAALTPTEVFDGLLMRERLGSTGLGKGIAIPHTRLGSCEQAVGAFLKLSNPVEFDSADQQPVDLFFGLIVPEQFTNQHLEILAELAELFSNDEFCDSIRRCDDSALLYSLLKDQLAK